MAQPATNAELDDLLGQVFMFGFWDTAPTPEIVELIETHRVGGIILFSRNIRDADQLADLTQQLQRVARSSGHPAPLFIATDQENGLVRRLGPDATTFPGNMALGAIGSEEMAYQVARASGEELLAQGINMNFAPVADVNNNPANPVIGVRSFGEDPQLVARLTAAAVRGYRDAGVIATLKHFPGHGDTAVDSHLALPTVPHTMERLRALELVPFQAGIAAGADCVMIAHLLLPRLMSGENVPATLSPTVVRSLLRDQCAFDGVAVTDCLEMDAVSRTVGVPRGAVMALTAGNDLVLISHHHELQHAALAAVREALRAGMLSADAVAGAAERVLTLKRRYLSWDLHPAGTGRAAVGSAAHTRLRDQVYEQSITLVRDEPGLLPLRLRPEERILVVAQPPTDVSQAVDVGYAHDVLVNAIRLRHANVQTLLLGAQPDSVDRESVAAWAQAADVIIMGTINANLDLAQAGLMESLLASGRRVIGLALCNPYDLLAFPRLPTYLATYDYSAPALLAAVRVLFGEVSPTGTLPVTLPGLVG